MIIIGEIMNMGETIIFVQLIKEFGGLLTK